MAKREEQYYGIEFDSDEPARAWWTCSQQCVAALHESLSAGGAAVRYPVFMARHDWSLL
jgi:hypothetical protein